MASPLYRVMLHRAHGRLPFTLGELSMGLLGAALLAFKLGIIGFGVGVVGIVAILSGLRRADLHRRDWYVRPFRALFARGFATPLDSDSTHRSPR